jgi:DNA-binding response OmpR family regulator
MDTNLPAHVLVVGGNRWEVPEPLGDANGGFRITSAESAFQAVGLIRDRFNPFDIILLDMPLPDSDARALCIHLWGRSVLVPIVVISADDEEETIVGALNAGAIDYLVKPISFGVLIARLRAHIRAHETRESAVVQIGDYLFRPAEYALLDRNTGRRVRLTPKEVGILKCLYRAGGDTVACNQLVQEVWRCGGAAEIHTLETHISRLRRKLENDANDPSILVKRGNGYALNREPADAAYRARAGSRFDGAHTMKMPVIHA